MNYLFGLLISLGLLTATLSIAFALDVIGTVWLATYDEIRHRLWFRRNGIRLVHVSGMVRRWKS